MESQQINYQPVNVSSLSTPLIENSIELNRQVSFDHLSLPNFVEPNASISINQMPLTKDISHREYPSVQDQIRIICDIFRGDRYLLTYLDRAETLALRFSDLECEAFSDTEIAFQEIFNLSIGSSRMILRKIKESLQRDGYLNN